MQTRLFDAEKLIRKARFRQEGTVAAAVDLIVFTVMGPHGGTFGNAIDS